MQKVKEFFNKINFKDRKVYIPLIIIVIIALICILFGISSLVSKLSSNKEKVFVSSANEVDFSEELSADSDRKEVEVTASTDKDKSNCVNNICVTSVDVSCYSDRGVINFTVVNNNSSAVTSGYLKLYVGDYSAIIWYDELTGKGTYNGFHAYEGYDLINTDSKNYYVSELNDADRTSITSFIYYSCLANRNYYELDYDGERVLDSNDEDVVTKACIKQEDVGKPEDEIELSSVLVLIDPCANYKNLNSNTESEEVKSPASEEVKLTPKEECEKDNGVTCEFKNPDYYPICELLVEKNKINK